MKVPRVLLASVLVIAIAVVVAACVRQHTEPTPSTQVAATVNGVEIPETRVQSYINKFRARSADLSTQAGWEAWLADSGYTEQSYRIHVIDSLVQDELIRQAAKDCGIKVDQDEISAQIEATKANYDTEENWQRVLSAAGYTEAEYRAAVELTALSKELKETQVAKPKASNDQVQTYFNAHASQYEGRRSSCILYNRDDEEKARETLAALQESQNLSADFAAAAQEQSADVSTAKNGGDMGWDCLTTLPNEYQRALDKLKVGEMCSEPVQTDYGFYLILCTGEFTSVKDAGDVVVEAVPSEISATLMNSLNTELYAQAFDAYLLDLRAQADVVIYNSDGSVYTPPAADAAAGNGTGAGAAAATAAASAGTPAAASVAASAAASAGTPAAA